ncbi:hypothetical protein D918_00123 [Trichuris suis]|nr:hypothetical protein D918_00123 [Trichuris suis]
MYFNCPWFATSEDLYGCTGVPVLISCSERRVSSLLFGMVCMGRNQSRHANLTSSTKKLLTISLWSVKT